MELLRDVHGLLAGHRVEDEHNLVRVQGISHERDFAHHLAIDGRAPRGIDDYDAGALALRLHEGSGAEIRKLLLFRGLEDGHAELLAQRAELLARGHAIWVRRDEQRLRAILAQMEGELGGRCGLARSLEADEHDHRRWFGRHRQRRRAAAEDVHQLFVDDGDDLLRAAEALHHFGAERPLADGGDELADDLEVDVGFEQRDTHLAHRVVEVLFGD